MRCGSAVLRGGTSTLSTFVRTPVEYQNEEEEQAIGDSVISDVQHITSDAEIKPWAGVVKMSVKELNLSNGATQFCPWAGPVKGVPSTAEEFWFHRVEHNEENHRKRKAVDDELEDYRLKTAKVVCNIVYKIKAMEELGMTEEANKLKQDLVNMKDPS
jgi:hypothetical protein|eukprot:122348-Prymnesium_polylepis.1